MSGKCGMFNRIDSCLELIMKASQLLLKQTAIYDEQYSRCLVAGSV